MAKLTTIRRALSALPLVLVLGSLAVIVVQRATAATKPEFRVIPTNSISVGPRGAEQYHGLLTRMTDEGWRYDHSLDGFVVFRR